MKGDLKMKSLNYSVLSSICALLVGVFLIVWPELAVTYLVITIGALFFLPGIIGLLGYFIASRKSDEQEEVSEKKMFPIVALGSSLLGLWLMVMPSFFVNILMYLLGGVLVLGGLRQLMAFMAVRTELQVPLICYLIPVLVLGAGLLVLFNPFEAATVPFVVFGVSAVIYALTDLLRLMRYRHRQNAEVTDVKIIEEE